MDMGEFAGYSEDQQVYRMQLHVRNSLSLFRSSQYLQAVYIRKLLGISATRAFHQAKALLKRLVQATARAFYDDAMVYTCIPSLAFLCAVCARDNPLLPSALIKG